MARASAARSRHKDSEKETGEREDGPQRHTSVASVWEWVFGAAGLAFIVAAIGYLVYAAAITPGGPPAIELRATSVERAGPGYLVIVSVENAGDTTAAQLEIEGELLRDGDVLETSSATLDYVPRFSDRTIGLYFSMDPGAHELRLRPLGYAKP